MEKNLNKISNIKYDSNIEPNELVKQYKFYFKDPNINLRDTETMVNNTISKNKKSKYQVELAIDSKYVSQIDDYKKCLNVKIYDKKDMFTIIKEVCIYHK